MVLILKDKLGICEVGIFHAGSTTGKNYKRKKGVYTLLVCNEQTFCSKTVNCYRFKNNMSLKLYS